MAERVERALGLAADLRLTQAAALLEQQLAVVPHDGQAWAALALVASLEGRRRVSGRAARKARNSADLRTWALLAERALFHDDIGHAQSFARRAADGGDPSGVLTLALVLLRLNALGQAAQLLSELERRPSLDRFLRQRIDFAFAQLLERRGQHAEALQRLRLLLADEALPLELVLRCEIGVAHLLQYSGRPDEAVAQLEQARQLRPQLADELLPHLSSACIRAGQHTRGEALLLAASAAPGRTISPAEWTTELARLAVRGRAWLARRALLRLLRARPRLLLTPPLLRLTVGLFPWVLVVAMTTAMVLLSSASDWAMVALLAVLVVLQAGLWGRANPLRPPRTIIVRQRKK